MTKLGVGVGRGGGGRVELELNPHDLPTHLDISLKIWPRQRMKVANSNERHLGGGGLSSS